MKKRKILVIDDQMICFDHVRQSLSFLKNIELIYCSCFAQIGDVIDQEIDIVILDWYLDSGYC